MIKKFLYLFILLTFLSSSVFAGGEASKEVAKEILKKIGYNSFREELFSKSLFPKGAGKKFGGYALALGFSSVVAYNYGVRNERKGQDKRGNKDQENLSKCLEGKRFDKNQENLGKCLDILHSKRDNKNGKR